MKKIKIFFICAAIVAIIAAVLIIILPIRSLSTRTLTDIREKAQSEPAVFSLSASCTDSTGNVRKWDCTLDDSDKVHCLHFIDSLRSDKKREWDDYKSAAGITEVQFILTVSFEDGTRFEVHSPATGMLYYIAETDGETLRYACRAGGAETAELFTVLVKGLAAQ